MALKLYLARRWGNAESVDGPDDWDTILLVRAATVAEAARVADDALAHHRLTKFKAGKPVQPFCVGMYEIGIDAASDQEPGVVLHPVIDFGVFATSGNYRCWVRDNQGDEWHDAREAYGDDFDS